MHNTALLQHYNSHGGICNEYDAEYHFGIDIRLNPLNLGDNLVLVFKTQWPREGRNAKKIGNFKWRSYEIVTCFLWRFMMRGNTQ